MTAAPANPYNPKATSYALANQFINWREFGRTPQWVRVGGLMMNHKQKRRAS